MDGGTLSASCSRHTKFSHPKCYSSSAWRVHFPRYQQAAISTNLGYRIIINHAAHTMITRRQRATIWRMETKRVEDDRMAVTRKAPELPSYRCAWRVPKHIIIADGSPTCRYCRTLRGLVMYPNSLQGAKALHRPC